jgi:hypothetical protein
MIEEDRLQRRQELRHELSEINKTLSGAAKRAKVTDYEKFQNAGYEGLYGMNTCTLKSHRNMVPKTHLLDYMGELELSAHIRKARLTIGFIEARGSRCELEACELHRLAGQKTRNLFLALDKRPENELVEKPLKLKRLKAAQHKNIDGAQPS